MAPRVLLGVAALALVVAVEGCAFTKQACMPEICSKLNLKSFDDLLNPQTNLLKPSITFNPNDESSRGDWNSVAIRNTLGNFFGIYNPRYNEGVFSADKWAVRDKAPSLNYLSFRNSFGDQYVPSEEAQTLSECCDKCRTTPGCLIYQFNPYVNTIEDDNGNEIGRAYDEEGAGDCYLIFQNSKANSLEKVNKRCSNTSSTKFFSPSTKPTFYGGLCNTDVADDPHFVGARGTRYDFNGELDKSFCLLADTRLQVNTLLRGYTDPAGGEVGIRSWMKELGFVWVDANGQKHTLQLVARNGKAEERGEGFLSTVILDGAAVGVPAKAGDAINSGDLSFGFVGTKRVGRYDVDNFRLVIGDLLDLGIAMRVAHPKLQAPDDAEVHFNINLNKIAATESIHGVLGQTYRQSSEQALKAIKYSILSRILGAPVQADGKTGKGFLEGEVADYVTSSVTSADCKFSSL